jgi:hypothetical protein
MTPENSCWLESKLKDIGEGRNNEKARIRDRHRHIDKIKKTKTRR